jgi:hypothetical protein
VSGCIPDRANFVQFLRVRSTGPVVSLLVPFKHIKYSIVRMIIHLVITVSLNLHWKKVTYQPSIDRVLCETECQKRVEIGEESHHPSDCQPSRQLLVFWFFPSSGNLYLTSDRQKLEEMI